MKWILIATAALVMAGGGLDALQARELDAPQDAMEVAQAGGKSEVSDTRVTLVVRGMMKSKSGAT